MSFWWQKQTFAHRGTFLISFRLRKSQTKKDFSESCAAVTLMHQMLAYAAKQSTLSLLRERRYTVCDNGATMDMCINSYHTLFFLFTNCSLFTAKTRSCKDADHCEWRCALHERGKLSILFADIGVDWVRERITNSILTVTKKKEPASNQSR